MSAETNEEWDGFIDLRVGLTIYPEQDRAMEKVLADLAERCPAQFLLLTDTSGQMLAARGQQGTLDFVALASLIAGDMAASQEVARITGQYQSCQLVIREGQQTKSLMIEAGPHLILYMQIAADVPLGWARLLIQEAAPQIEKIIATPPSDAPDLTVRLTDEHLTSLLDQSLDSLWTTD